MGVGSITSLAFSPDSKLLAVGFGYSIDNGNGESVLHIWNASTGEERATLRGHRAAVFGVALRRMVRRSPRPAATAPCGCGTRSPAEGVSRGNKSIVLTVAFAPDGATLASGSTDERLKLWDVAPDLARNTLHRPTTRRHCLGVFTPTTGFWPRRPGWKHESLGCGDEDNAGHSQGSEPRASDDRGLHTRRQAVSHRRGE